jgi:hypothetical protein
VPDYNDFSAAIDDLRPAFHCAISLFHLSDWVYVVHRTYINANFTYRDKNGFVQPVTDEKTFANALGQLHPDFDLIHGNRKFRKASCAEKSSTTSCRSEQRCQHARTSTGFGEGGYGTGPYGPTPVFRTYQIRTLV